MKKVTLFKDIQSSVIGFGCAPIQGAIDSKTGKKAIIHALDMGVNHFDLARSYGYGEAEKFVGNLIAPLRDELVISSKFGIKANAKARLFRPVKPIMRTLMDLKKRKSPKSDDMKVVKPNSISDLFHDRITLNVHEMNKSLEESLKALKTDYLDFFFIHEPLETITNIEELIDESQKLKKAGKIRAFGIAYTQNQTILHQNYLNEFDVLQFNNSPGVDGYEKLIELRGDKPNIFFSPLRGGSQQMPVNEKLIKMHHDFPNSVMLCSMFNINHITANTNLFKN